MNNDLREIARRILELSDEIEQHMTLRNRIELEQKRIFNEYQEKSIDHETYTFRLKHLLRGNPKRYWQGYYTSTINSLIAEARALNSQMAYMVSKDMMEAGISKESEEIMSKLPAPVVMRGKQLTGPLKEVPLSEIKKHEPARKPTKRTVFQKPVFSRERMPKSEEPKPHKAEAEVKVAPKTFEKIKRIVKREEIHERPAAAPQKIRDYVAVHSEEEEPVYVHKDSAARKILEKARTPDPEKAAHYASMPKNTEYSKPDQVTLFGTLWDRSYFRYILKKFISKKKQGKGEEEFKSWLPEEKLEIEDYGLKDTLILEEARQIEHVIENKELLKIHQPSKLGYISTITIKKITSYLLENFPDTFRNLYSSIRLSNMNILSNTYTNIMIFLSTLSFIISVPAYSFLFTITGNNPLMILVKSVVMTILTTGIVFFSFYAYPGIKLKGRRHNIEKNLPFAINHVSAVATSGVPPIRMFRLISESEEYGEISVEFSKIVEFTDLLGYDLLTAMKSVSSTTPSRALREFFEGFVSTIESGGDILNYLRQESEEQMTNYEITRQKYNEIISTASDIYTGILLAAPLFFIVTLTLVSMLGGKVLGFDANVMIALGTYVLIPVLNLMFIVFFSLSQPGV
ncbi:type II secretion system F family protein [Candidatus Woesearchaeota archaeon]|nr:type II secretion system F family protein [Candidatus Woesearchaeota archaeon]